MEDRHTRKIIHIDMDAFFASVEQRDNPELRGKPVAVGSPNARGVVAAASYEARKFKVHSALPSVIAAKRCRNLIFVPPRFDVYRSVSSQIREIFSRHTDLIEPLSLDEAYLDVTTNKQGITLATEIAHSIRADIFRETGLTASAGISYNKFLAKMASDVNKPNGYCVIPPQKGAVFIASLPIEKFHGIGPATARRMHEFGVKTGADLLRYSLDELTRAFGKAGRHYFDLARGIDHREVNPERERKSIGAEDTFSVDIETLEEARRELAPLIDKVWNKTRQHEMVGRTATIKVKFFDFEQITRSRTVEPFQDRRMFEDVVDAILKEIFPSDKPVRLLGVTMSGFYEDGTMTGQSRQLTFEF